MSYEDSKFEEAKGLGTQDDDIVHMAPSNMQGLALGLGETSHVPRLVLRCKVSIVGDQSVGKSAITQMFHSGGHMYPKNYIMTTSVDFCMKEVKIPETNASVELFLFDCAGQSIFNQREFSSKHWDGTSFVICVYDVSNRESFQSVQMWLQKVRSVRSGQSGGPLPGVLLANKIDLREGGINSRAVVDSQEGFNLAQQCGLEYFECSAMTGRDIDRPFNYIASQFHGNYESTVRRANALNE
ncbi:hypothetical protein TrVE_jg11349 [Triparma verrucosa]|uniref:Uncharacterized protein n=2 Tax=Triparma TaxID=722752 RepID=A0A9W7A5D0_9STRA|nr:hypothetical protein TrST_g10184 [Triparma strigata]GMI08642.1 hypothetical protein TrVE_jg11349 [Triparma verrucosa]